MVEVQDVFRRYGKLYRREHRPTLAQHKAMSAIERWIESRKSDLLNVGYFHVVFTLPSELRPLLYQKSSGAI